MNGESILMQRLVRALDDSRSLYEKAVDKVVHPRLRDLLECTIGAHWLIADDLAKHIVEAGGEVARQGSRLGPLRTFLTGRSAQISFDTDMAYTNFAAQREAGILRGLHEAAGSVRHAACAIVCGCTADRTRVHRRLRAMMQLRVGLQAARAFPGRVTAR